MNIDVNYPKKWLKFTISTFKFGGLNKFIYFWPKYNPDFLFFD